MVAAILPLYLVTTLGFSPLQYGVIEGLYQGASALVRLGAGFLGDRMGRHKLIASIGYGLSAVCKLLLVIAGGAWGAISAIVLLDRTGKGIRTAPRDAMISLTAPRSQLGLAFGVHRTMDTAGAMIGPVVAFALLAVAPDGFSSLFLVSFFVAVLGLLVIVLLVREPRKEVELLEKPDLRAAAGLLRGREFRSLTIAAGALGFATVSDGFLYLTLHERIDFDNALFPLLATGTAVLFMLLAAPLGRVADRCGRGRVLIGGYIALLAVYCVLMVPGIGATGLVLAVALLGVYYAATDGVLMALGSMWVPEQLRGSGLAFLGTATSVARLVAAIAFGALWTIAGIEAAMVVFGAALVLAMVLAARALRFTHA
jgi:MFS family permease